MEATLYKQDGSKQGMVTLPEEFFNLPWNDNLVHQVIVGIEHNMRSGVAHTKGRSEVRGGGRKPWRQKGTGRARHGSRRSPLWVGGGVTFGPSNEKNYSVSINKKMRAKAFLTVLSQKARSNQIAFIDTLSMEKPSTKAGVTLTTQVCGDEGAKKKNSCLIVLVEGDENIRKSFSNLIGVTVKSLNVVNTRDLFVARQIVFINPEETLTFVEQKGSHFMNTEAKGV